MGEIGLYRPDRRLESITCQGIDPESGDRHGLVYTGRDNRASVIDQARAAGWRIGRLNDGTPDAMCPACAKPDPSLTKLLGELGRSTGRIDGEWR